MDSTARPADTPDAPRDRRTPAPLALRLGLLRRRHGLDGPTAQAVAVLAFGEAWA